MQFYDPEIVIKKVNLNPWYRQLRQWIKKQLGIIKPYHYVTNINVESYVDLSVKKLWRRMHARTERTRNKIK